jgi:hypothetical protein
MKYQPRLEFSAQAVSFRALQCLYARLNERGENEYDYVPIVVFAAVSIEAYINSIGSRKIVFWDQIERLSWKKKSRNTSCKCRGNTELGKSTIAVFNGGLWCP